MRLFILAAFLFFSATAQCQQAAFETGNSLRQKLYAKSNIANGIAYGYILGVHDSWSGIMICTQIGADPSQMILIVRKFLSDHPEKLHYSAMSLVADALREAFPCPHSEK